MNLSANLRPKIETWVGKHEKQLIHPWFKNERPILKTRHHAPISAIVRPKFRLQFFSCGKTILVPSIWKNIPVIARSMIFQTCWFPENRRNFAISSTCSNWHTVHSLEYAANMVAIFHGMLCSSNMRSFRFLECTRLHDFLSNLVMVSFSDPKSVRNLHPEKKTWWVGEHSKQLFHHSATSRTPNSQAFPSDICYMVGLRTVLAIVPRKEAPSHFIRYYKT